MRKLVIAKVLDGTGYECDTLVRSLTALPKEMHDKYLFFIVPGNISMDSLTIEQAEELYKFLGDFISDSK